MSLIITFKVIGENVKRSSILQPSNVEYNAEVHDKFTLCRLKQIYHITIDNIEETSYQFPVNHNSTRYNLLIKTPREEIRSSIKKISNTNKICGDIENSEHVTSTEKFITNSGVHKLSICNLLKNDEITVEYGYSTEILYNNSHNIFCIPKFISPRYDSDYVPNISYNVNFSVKIMNVKLKSIQCSIPDVSVNCKNKYILVCHTLTEPLYQDIEITYCINPKTKTIKSNEYSSGEDEFSDLSDEEFNADFLFNRFINEEKYVIQLRSKSNIKRNKTMITDKDTDDLFNYFMNEDNFNKISKRLDNNIEQK
jgi:hypothetical protein